MLLSKLRIEVLPLLVLYALVAFDSRLPLIGPTLVKPSYRTCTGNPWMYSMSFFLREESAFSFSLWSSQSSTKRELRSAWRYFCIFLLSFRGSFCSEAERWKPTSPCFSVLENLLRRSRTFSMFFRS